ncbi:MAG: hypothetical protein Q8K51_02845, partial [Nitrospirota bacterium]|nr:hypothetical protein [Nitrospirota bacterium]
HPDLAMTLEAREKRFYEISLRLLSFKRLLKHLTEIPLSGFPSSHIVSLMSQIPVRHGMKAAYKNWRLGKGMDEGEKDKDWLKAVGTALIAIGVGVWIVYAVGRYLLGWDVTDRDFLAYHLMIIIPGMLLRHHRFFFGSIRRLLSRRGDNAK